MPMALAIQAPLPTFSVGGAFFAMLEAALSYFNRERLTVEERELVTHLKAIAEDFGTYVLEAKEREDLLVRVDTLLGDPAYYRAFYGVLGVLPRIVKLPDIPNTAASPESTYQVISRALGSATRPHLRNIHRYMRTTVEYLGSMLATTSREDFEAAAKEFLAASVQEGADPLWFLSTPEVPVPVAQGMLAGLRCDVFAVSACSAVFSGRPVEGWLGLALAEYWVEQAGEFVALFASMPGMKMPDELVPPHMRFDMKILEEQTRVVCEAYARFNADAKRSGEPVYPSAS